MKNTAIVKELVSKSVEPKSKAGKKRRQALRRNGCYSNDPETTRQLAYVADHLKKIQRYIKAAGSIGNSHKDEDFYYVMRKKLREANMPISPKMLLNLIEMQHLQTKTVTKARNKKRRPNKRSINRKIQQKTTIDAGDVYEEAFLRTIDERMDGEGVRQNENRAAVTAIGAVVEHRKQEIDTEEEAWLNAGSF